MISYIGKVLVFLGASIVIIGLIFMLSQKVPWIGRLPGDILIKKENFTFYFPLSTCVIISLILSLIFIFLGKR